MKTIKAAIIGTGHIGPAYIGNCGSGTAGLASLLLPQGPKM